MNNDSIDMNKLLSMLSKMDKKKLEDGLAKVKELIDSNNKDNTNH